MNRIYSGVSSLALIVLFYAFPLGEASAAPPLPEEMQKTLTLFFNLLKESKLDQAYDVVLTNTRIKGREEDVKQLKKQTTEALAAYGPILGFEVIEQKRVGMCLLQVVCLSRSDHLPLRWRFTYYRPGETWKLLDIMVDDKISDLFESKPASSAGRKDP